MKKNLFLFFALCLTPSIVFAGKPLVAEAPFNDHGTAGCVSISTSAWTAIPTTATAGRVGLYVTNVSTNTGNMNGTFDNTVGIGIQPILFKPGITQYHGAADSEPLYLRSLHTSAEDACYQEMKQ